MFNLFEKCSYERTLDQNKRGYLMAWYVRSDWARDVSDRSFTTEQEAQSYGRSNKLLADGGFHVFRSYYQSRSGKPVRVGLK